MHDVALKLALIGALGIGAQWLAWRLHLPAIVLLLAAGFAAGPLGGFIDPVADFGEIYRPLVSLAVAIILFEGGLTLNFREIRETSTAVRRLITIGGPLVWALTSFAAHYVAGLSWPSAAVLGAILVVTGPTVIMPLLRHAQLAARPAALLRWEAIVNDAVGALFAVIAFEAWLVFSGAHQADDLALRVVAAAFAAFAGGIAAGRAIAWLFVRGHVPEYLKAPVIFAAVLGAYTATNLILEEAGLMTVTVMGIMLANSRIASLTEMRRFKETVTVLLVSGLFILLTAALDMNAVLSLDWKAALFVLLVLAVIRPIAVTLATLGTGITWSERLLVGWIAPRGIVAVAVSGLFGAALLENGVGDAPQIVALAFAVVVSTILLHGFTLSPLARLLGLKSAAKPGILIVGGSRFATALAAKLKELDIPVLIADSEWDRIREARLADIPVYFGEVLSEDAHHELDLKRFSTVIAATANSAYNTLVCTDFGPEVGRSRVFQVGRNGENSQRKSVAFTLGGRPLTREPEMSYLDFVVKLAQGWQFQATRLTDEFDYQAFRENRPADARQLLWVNRGGALVFPSIGNGGEPSPGDTIVGFAPAKSMRPSSENTATETKEPENE